MEQKSRSSEAADSAGPLVLVVDDVLDNREMYAEYLRHAGMRVATAASAEEAMETARRDAPTVVVMDLALPGMDGWEATRLLKKLVPKTRIVVVSGHGLREHQERAKEAGADAFYEKPLLPIDLLEGVNRLLPGGRRPGNS